MKNKTFEQNLYHLAHLYNVQIAYYDVAHKRRQASADSLLAVLQALGAPVDSLNDVPSAFRERRQALRQKVLEAVTVVWDGEYPLIKVYLPLNLAQYPMDGYLELESGERQVFRWSADELKVVESIEDEGASYVVKEIKLPGDLPRGYHKFFLETKVCTKETLIISAPRMTYLPSQDTEERKWGAFLPLYALHTENSWGSGDYASLEALTGWISDMGGEVVATLPLLPVFLDEPFEPSPYAPVSRLMWNEFYIDVDRVPELAECTRAQELLQSSPLKDESRERRDLPLVDYRRIMSLKRSVLEECCHYLITERPAQFRDFQRFIHANPVVEDYARFRAAVERQHRPWHSWPYPLCDGTLSEGDYDEGTKNYYIYAQWLAHQQVQVLWEKSRDKGMMLYFDLPLGTHPEGYDVWRERSIFSSEMSVGAPPDVVFTRGQDWGFPPLHPEKIREQGYRYVIDYLRHHLQHAGMLRVDHVMGLHRLFWVPKGLDASQGVYVHYQAEELYAILALESHRYQSIIVGEDLGTVPSYVRPKMAKHNLQRMYVVHYELACNPRKPLGRILGNVVASLNTHDMPTFSAFWQGLDIQERLGIGLLDRKGAQVERRTRQVCKDALVGFLRNKGLLKKGCTEIRDILKACLLFLSGSKARTVLVNLEDLWLETRPQNVPGTDNERPNWRRKARYTFEEFCRMPEVRDTLKEIDRLRKQGENEHR
jgi:4-alpha-glucanotransferase